MEIYRAGAWVRVRIGSDEPVIQGEIVSAEIHGHGMVTYNVIWWDGGAPRAETFASWQVQPVDPEEPTEKFGFANGH